MNTGNIASFLMIKIPISLALKSRRWLVMIDFVMVIHLFQKIVLKRLKNS